MMTPSKLNLGQVQGWSRPADNGRQKDPLELHGLEAPACRGGELEGGSRLFFSPETGLDRQGERPGFYMSSI